MKYSVIEELNNPDFNPDDYAPNFDTPKKNGKNKNPELKGNTVTYVAITVILAIVLAVFGTIFTFKSTDETNKASLVLSYFTDSKTCEYLKSADGCDYYVVYYDDCITGYGVFLTEKGFSGPVDMLICVNGNGEISNVSIISENEIKGLGSRIKNADFLGEFKGLKSNDKIKVDMISGATDSCNAIKSAVESVLKSNVNLDSISRETGKKVLTPSELEKKINSGSKKDNTEEETEAEETTRLGNNYFDPNINNNHVNDGPQIGGNTGAPNYNTGDGNVGADGNDVTTEYETETDTTDETTGEDTTATPVTEAVTTAPPVETTAPPVETTAPPVETTAPPVETTAEPVTDSEPVSENPDEGGNG